MAVEHEMYSDDERSGHHHQMAVPMKDLVLEHCPADFWYGVRGVPDDIVTNGHSVAFASNKLGELPLCTLSRGR